MRGGPDRAAAAMAAPGPTARLADLTENALFPRAAPPKMPSVVRAIASDVDGTLLDSSSKCHPAAAAAVADACAHDHVRFFIATGKCRAGALAALPSHVSDSLEGGVFVNGLVAYVCKVDGYAQKHGSSANRNMNELLTTVRNMLMTCG